MGRQINFYMTESDERAFMDYVRSGGKVAVFKCSMPTEKIPFLKELPPRGESFWWALFLWDTANSSHPKLDYIAEQDYYVVDSMTSEVIEFSRSYIDEGRLVRGRIWAEMVGWERGSPEHTFEKSDSFKKWFNRLANWIRRNSVRNAVGDYMFPEAAEYLEHGGRLVQVVFSDNSDIPGC